MNYEQTLDFLFNRFQAFHNKGSEAYKPGLDTTLGLAAAFGDPHKKIRCIHVGGTNGKGSTAHSLASVMMASGLKVGLYTSPHLIDFTERIRINGVPIPKDEVISFVRRFRDMKLQGVDPSFFELTTIMAFDHFARHEVDIAVIEVGLGGRLDSTNIITPILSVITNVSFDHTDLLGHTLDAIAVEKAGIIKPGIPAVIGRRNSLTDSVFESHSDSTIVFAQDMPTFSSYTCKHDNIEYHRTPWGDVESCLTGNCQPENMQTILTTLNILQDIGLYVFTNETVSNGLRNIYRDTGLMGRWMIVNEQPLIIADTAHNPDGWKYLAEYFSNMQPENLHFVLGFVNDKDYAAVLRMLPKDANYYFVQPSVKRAAEVSRVAHSAKEVGISGESFDNVIDGFKCALRKVEKIGCENEMIFVGGSTFVVADFLRYYPSI